MSTSHDNKILIAPCKTSNNKVENMTKRIKTLGFRLWMRLHIGYITGKENHVSTLKKKKPWNKS